MTMQSGVTAVAGIGQTEFSKNSGRSELQLACEAICAAVDDAGISMSDVDGLVSTTVDQNDELEIMAALGIPHVTWHSRQIFGGGGASSVMQHAAAAVASGAAKYVVVYRAFNERSGNRYGQPHPKYGGLPPKWNWYLPYGVDTAAKIYGLWFRAYMDRYGLTNEDFGRYTVVARDFAASNPNAWFYKRPITLEDHQNSRWIVYPVLRLLDCCQESDGGVAMVVTTTERARDMRQPVVQISAAAQSSVDNADIMFSYYHDDLTTFPEAELCARTLWETSGLTPGDIDAAMIYENFSPVVFYQLEAFGFCGPGEAKDFIAEGNIGRGGKLPVNTHGGLLGEAYIHGLNNLLEAVRQVRGTSANQVGGAEHVLAAAGRSAVVLSRG